jgi:periplasmic protein TonB
MNDGGARRAGVLGTVTAHGLLVVLGLLLAQRASGPMPVVYAVDLLAAPLPNDAPARAATEATPTAEAEDAAPVEQPKPKPKSTKEPPTLPKDAKRNEKAVPVKSTTGPAPGETPSTGNDAITLKTPGRQFPYPGYLENVVNQVYRRWARPPGGSRLQAEIVFTIQKDGSVTDIEVLRSSGNYGFDLSARGAVEAAANSRAFGPLPGGFNGESLPIAFYFAPRNP